MFASIDIPRKAPTERPIQIGEFTPGSPPRRRPGLFSVVFQEDLNLGPDHYHNSHPTPPRTLSGSFRTMDEFAQSREDDDLFADEFEPISDPPTVTEDQKLSIKPPLEEPTFSNLIQSSNVRREQGQERRARGGRGGLTGRGNNGLGASRYATSADTPPTQNATTNPASTSDNMPPQSTVPTPDNGPPPAEPATGTRNLAVRGDRSATGGPAHKKLTEEELSAKMAKMAVINAEKAERHRLSEADQAAYQHREKELAKEKREKAVAEKKNERVMEMERAKNRDRKMKTQGGREWDSEKLESDIVDGRGRGRSSEYVRGGHGGVIRGRGGLAESRFSGPEETDEIESGSRGRGGFQSRGRARGGRGGRGGKASAPVPPSAEDFPSLPTQDKISSEVETVKSPTGEKGPGDWAEEMATPIEEKKMDV
ncbi:uncharacterized protein LY89DRAFT_688291 [Mollisia scopiformis]|uniref:Uncharacterized protein n=1 Tax=Mollisia scopiformis TaxID=149040 RepID=A0A194WXG1_MOLSC|nr:uncharacterized protein LY89DRAFT_688291 [Mollisia scopiformis]KUJ12671.1 hypothetical protein LY89DRAFT_688291 [Mollisia scopiformis]